MNATSALRLSLLIFFFVVEKPASGQRRIFSKEILSAVASTDGLRIALADRDSVYILKTAGLTEEASWAHKQPFLLLLGFHPSNKDVLISQARFIRGGASNYNWHKEAFQRTVWEYPKDSIINWSISKKEIMIRLPGNYYMDYGKQTDQFAAVANLYFPFKGLDGDSLYAAKGSEIFTKNGAAQKLSRLGKSARLLRKSPDLKYFAAIWYGDANTKKDFSLSLHDFASHEELFSIDSLDQMPYDLAFSPDSRWLAASGSWGSGEHSSIRIIDLYSKTIAFEIKEIASSSFETISHLQFSAAGNELSFKTNEDWMVFDLKEKRLTQKINRNLAGLFYLDAAFDNGGRVVFVGRQNGALGELTNKSSVNTIARKDVAIYTAIEKAQSERYTDTGKYQLMANSAVVGNETPLLRFNREKTFFTSVIGNQLQVWSTQKRKKILDIQFGNAIKAFPANNGKTVFIIEDKVQQYYGEYRLLLLDLESGNMKASPIVSRTGKQMRNDDSFSCIQKGDRWLCIDGTENLWQVNEKDLSIAALAKKEGEQLVQLITSGDNLFLSSHKDNKTTIYKWSSDFEKLAELAGRKMMSVVEDNIYLWEKNGARIDILEENKLAGSIDVREKLVSVDVQNNAALLHFEKEGKNFIQVVQGKQVEATVPVDVIGGTFHLLAKNEILYENDGFTSFVNKASYRIPWTVQTPRVLANTNFDVSLSGENILFDKLLINLKEIEMKAIDKYATASLLNDSAGLTIVEIEDKPYASVPGFTLQKINLATNDTLRSKTWIKTPEGVSSIGFTHDQLITSSNKNWALTYTAPGMLASSKPPQPVLWNVKTMQSTTLPANIRFLSAAFLPGEKEMVLLSEKSTYRYQLAPFRLIGTSKVGWNTAFGSTGSDHLSINAQNVEWKKVAGDSLIPFKTFYSKEYLNTAIFVGEGAKIYAGSSTGNIFIWESNGAASPEKILSFHTAPITRLISRGNFIYSLSASGEIGIIDTKKNEWKLLIKTLQKNGEPRVAMITPDGYYKIDQDLLNDLHFVKKGEVFPVSSFELFGNRPDKVYEAIGLANPEVIHQLKKSWEARVLRLGLDPASIGSSNHRPAVESSLDQLPLITKDSVVKVSFTVSDKLQSLQTVHLRLNGVPLFGAKGYQLNDGIHQFKLTPNIALLSGKNTISIVAVNNKGDESIEQVKDIYYEMPPSKKRIIYAGIGVSNYKDSSMNLRFAADDVKNIASSLRHYADTIIAYTLVNEQATRENILTLKQKLLQTSPNDIVIVSFSGHGTTRKDKGFFFAGYDMDFKQPEKNGVSIKMIEDLLDSIPAYRKLLLLDACHSGEESNSIAKANLPQGVTATKIRGSVEDDAEINDTKDARHLLMKELFSDLSRGNGAFIISAAASNEFAYEGEEWKNGVFTMSFLQALRELKNSSAGGDSIQVKDLRKRIYQKVRTLTNGLQNPTSRQENGWWNWTF